MLFYPAALPLSAQTLTYVAGIIRRHRRQIGSCWRKLSPGRQSLLVLAYLRKGETFAELAAGFGIRDRDRLEIGDRDRRPAGRPRAEAAHRALGGEGTARVRGPGRHAHPRRPGSG